MITLLTGLVIHLHLSTIQVSVIVDWQVHNNDSARHCGVPTEDDLGNTQTTSVLP